MFILTKFEFEFYHVLIEFHNYGRPFYFKLHNECWEFEGIHREFDVDANMYKCLLEYCKKVG
jgi:hypothetical protein